MRDRIIIFAMFACASLVGIHGAYNAMTSGDRLDKDVCTPMHALDAYSEAGIVRAGERFAREGFAVTCALPDTGYGNRYPGIGLTGPSGPQAGDRVYHGDPPGAYWVVGLLMRWAGEVPLSLLRLVPTLVAFVSTAAFAWALAKTLGEKQALLVLVLCLATPMFSNMADSLYYHGYSMGLLLVQIAILVPWFGTSDPRGSVMRWGALVLIGLAQGLLSYTYCGVQTFAAVPIALVMTPEDRAIDWKQVWGVVLASGSAFVLAHLIHLGQSWLYFGDVRMVIDEYMHRANKSYWLDEAGLAKRTSWELRLFGFIETLRTFGAWTHLGGPAAVAVAAMTLIAVTFRRCVATLTTGWQFTFRSAAGPRVVLGLVAAVLVGSSWVLMKPHHAIAHMNMTARTMVLPYVLASIVLVRHVRIGVSRGEATVTPGS